MSNCDSRQWTNSKIHQTSNYQNTAANNFSFAPWPNAISSPACAVPKCRVFDATA